MTRFIKALFRPKHTLLKLAVMITTLGQIKSMPLSDELRRKVRRTYLRTLLLRRYDSKEMAANIVGHKAYFLTFDSLEYLFGEIFLNQDYCCNIGKADPLIVDCGSNIGISILYFKTKYPDATVISFEPDKSAFACLERTVAENNFKGVHLNRKAVSKTDGTLDFFYDEGNPGSLLMSTLKERIPKNKQVVEATRLSKYIDREVDFMKMDIEGAECDVLEELISAGKLTLIKQMVIEYHHHIVKGTDNFSYILQLLEKAGFGYQIEAPACRPLIGDRFQDVLIYAYRKSARALA